MEQRWHEETRGGEPRPLKKSALCTQFWTAPAPSLPGSAFTDAESIGPGSHWVTIALGLS